MKTLALYLMLSFLFACSVFAQADQSQYLLIKIAASTKQNLQEKVHLQLDKSYYSIGDTIWLKAWVVNADKNQPTALSEILYVDLINPKDSLQQSTRLALVNGTAQGDFILTDTLPEGQYHIRAYTRWMQNFSPDYFFVQPLLIGNALSSNIIANTSYSYSQSGQTSATINYKTLSGDVVTGKEVSYEIKLADKTINKGKSVTDQQGNITVNFSQDKSLAWIHTTVGMEKGQFIKKDIAVHPRATYGDIQFFPEGGKLINGISSKVGFKVLGTNGLGMAVSGEIANGDGKKIAEFKSTYAGMGNFTFTPMSGNSYLATVRFADGSETNLPLPKAENTGYVLSTEQDSISLTVNIFSSKDLVQNGELTLVAQSNGVVKYTAKKKLAGTSSGTLINSNRFPDGILQLTLFSPDGKPVAERLVFIHHATERLKLNIATNKTTYSPREKVQLTLTSTDAGGRPVEGNFAVAVTDAGKVPYNNEQQNTILSNLLLTSDLKGYIENPNYYFSNINQQKLQDLDNLLLTQGWRRFDWANVLSEQKQSVRYQPEQGIELTGSVTALNNQPLPGANVLMLSTKGSPASTVTDTQGQFKLDSLYFSADRARFTLQGTDKAGGKKVIVKIDKQPEAPEINFAGYPALSDPFLNSYLGTSNKRFENLKELGILKGQNTLKEVTITGKQKTIKEIAVQNSANLNGPGNASQVITFVDLLRCHDDVLQCLKTLASGVRFDSFGYMYSKRIADGDNHSMLVVVDGVPANEPPPPAGGIKGENPNFLGTGSILVKTPSSDIESIEILQPDRSAIYGFRGANGVVVITTKTGKIDYSAYDFKNDTDKAKPVISDYIQGYKPVRTFYSPVYNDPQTDIKIPDLRSTIYWNPQVLTDANGKATLEFYNTDGTGNFQIITEGLTNAGKLGRQVFGL